MSSTQSKPSPQVQPQPDLNKETPKSDLTTLKAKVTQPNPTETSTDETEYNKVKIRVPGLGTTVLTVH